MLDADINRQGHVVLAGAKLLVEIAFDARQALVVDIGKSEGMRRQRAHRIHPPCFTLEIKRRNAEPIDGILLPRR